MALSLITDISATCYTSQLQKIELVWICCRVSHLLPSANLLQRQRADVHFQRVIQHAIKSCRHLRHRLATRNLFSRQGRGAAVHFLFLQRHGQPRTDLRCHLLQGRTKDEPRNTQRTPNHPNVLFIKIGYLKEIFVTVVSAICLPCQMPLSISFTLLL